MSRAHSTYYRSADAPQRGMVLVLVLLVLALLSIGAIAFADRMLTERRATMVQGRQVQARALADSGVDYIRKFLTQDAETQATVGGTYNNSARFQGMLITGVDSEDPHVRGRFSVISPLIEQDDTQTGIRFGLEDESSRFNLNTLPYLDKTTPGAGRTLLMTLPGMTEEVADAILDWLDDDDELREYGAEHNEYSGLNPPYAPKNGPLDSVEELLQVRGVTPALLFGSDANRNGVLDNGETEPEDIAESTTGARGSCRGWTSYFTLYSYEANKRPDGTPRIDLNNSDLQVLHDELMQVVDGNIADFIIAYRQSSGPYTGTKKPSGDAKLNVDLTQAGKTQLTSVLDLVDAKIQVKASGGGGSGGSGKSGSSSGNNDTIVLSPIMSLGNAEVLNTLLDVAAANASPRIPGRININQASKTVILGIPGMTPEIADQIVARRQADATGPEQEQRHETWIMSGGLVALSEMKKFSPFMTTTGNVYRAQVVGYFEEGGPSARFEVVIDATGDLPRVVFWRELSHLGRGYPVETLGLAN